MFLFLRAIGVSRLAATFGGITFLLNPFLLVWLEHPLAGVPPWLPWMLLAGERLAAMARERPAAGVAMLAVASNTLAAAAGRWRQRCQPFSREQHPRQPGRNSGKGMFEPDQQERIQQKRDAAERRRQP